MTDTLTADDNVMQWAWDHTAVKSSSNPWSSEELDYWALIAWCLDETELVSPFEILTGSQKDNFGHLLKGLQDDRIQERQNELDGLSALVPFE